MTICPAFALKLEVQRSKNTVCISQVDQVSSTCDMVRLFWALFQNTQPPIMFSTSPPGKTSCLSFHRCKDLTLVPLLFTTDTISPSNGGLDIFFDNTARFY